MLVPLLAAQLISHGLELKDRVIDLALELLKHLIDIVLQRLYFLIILMLLGGAILEWQPIVPDALSQLLVHPCLNYLLAFHYLVVFFVAIWLLCVDLQICLLCVKHLTILFRVVLDDLFELLAGGVESSGGSLARAGACGFS